MLFESLRHPPINIINNKIRITSITVRVLSVIIDGCIEKSVATLDA